MNNATFVPENTCHHFTCRRKCLKFFWWWWIRMLPLLWCPFWFRSEILCPGFVTCYDAIQKILAFPVKTLLQLIAAFNSSVPVKSGNLSWYLACANFSKMQMFVNDCVHRSHRKIRLLCNFTTGYASIIQDQAFHALNVHSNDCCGPGTTMAGIVSDGRTAFFEMFIPFKCFIAAERLITVLCLKSSVDIRGFYAFVHKKLHHHTLLPAILITVSGLARDMCAAYQ